MRIGIDLDNTLICYDKVFTASAISCGLVTESWRGNKEQLRDYIRQLPNGEYKWQQLQGYVYAEAVVNAEAFPGVFRFLWRAKLKGYQLFIVSHKTKFAHHDSSKNLRTPALKWLKEKKYFDQSLSSLIDEVYFLSTLEEKIEKFNKLNLDVLIDDLKEVIEHPLLEHKIKSFHFGGERFTSWTGIENNLLGHIDEKDCYKLIENLSIGDASLCQAYKGGGNSSVWKVEMKDSAPLTIKYYHNDAAHSDRRVIEELSISIMRKNGIENIPSIVWTDNDIEVSVFEHIDAKVIETLNEFKIKEVAAFIENLNGVKEKIKSDFPLASAACLTGADVFKQINSRLLNLESACLENDELNSFILKKFNPLLELLEKWAQENWPTHPQFSSPLEISKQILTPSDIGAHNMLEDEKGRIYFIDFEYFGLDDPVKTTSDFLWHPKNKIDIEMGKYWVMLMTNIFNKTDLTFSQRLAISWPLYGLCWCLILLNEYRQNDWQKRIHSKRYLQNEYSAIKREQLQKANDLLDFIRLNYKNFPYVSKVQE
jgi:thiamine kinase-like enzyme